MTDSLKAFFDMGGYGLFIWAAYGVSLVALLCLTLIIRRRYNRAKAKLAATKRD